MDGDLEKAGKDMGIEVKTSMDVDRRPLSRAWDRASGSPTLSRNPSVRCFGPVRFPAASRWWARWLRKRPPTSGFAPAQTAAIRDQLKQQKTSERAQLFEDGIKKRLQQEGKLKIHQDVITRIVQSYTS